MSLFVFFISLLIFAQHVSGNHVPIIRSWRLRDVIALCWYVPWLREGGQVRLVGSASMDGFVSQLFLSTLNYDARSTTHQIDLYPQIKYVYVSCSILYIYQVKALHQNISGGCIYVCRKLNSVLEERRDIK